MSIKVVIERKFKGENLEQLSHLFNELRSKPIRKKGYISDEILTNSRDSRELIVISHWSSLAAWQAWATSKERKELEDKIARYVAEPVKTRTFEFAAMVRDR